MKRPSLTKGHAGVSLIELMIAMLLGAIIVAGLIQVLLANRKGYQLQENNNFMQQNLRFAGDRIGWSARMADFWGGIDAQQVQGLGDGTGASGCNSNWILSGKPGSNGAGGIFGYDGRAAFPISGCALVPNSDYVAGSDVLVVRYADVDPCSVPDGSTAVLDATTKASCLPLSSHYLVANVGQQAEIFGKGSSIPVTGDTRRYVYPYRVEVYYLQPCSDRSTACSAASDGGMPRPTLMRARLQEDGTLEREPLAEGIEQLQFEYGVSTDGQTVSQYKIASAVTAAEWPTVLAIRMTMLARSGARDVAMLHSGTFNLSQQCSFTLSDSGAVTLATTGGDCTGLSLGATSKPQQFPRAISQQVVQLRNRIRG